jgi:hypothetical protein
MRKLTHQKLRWLLQLTAALKFFPIPHILWIGPLWLLPVSKTENLFWKPSFEVDVLEAMNVSWRWSMSSLRTKIESSILKG